MVKQLSKAARSTLDAIAHSKLGATCAMCSKEWTVWYVGNSEIGKQRCRCEFAPGEKLDRFGMTAQRRAQMKRWAAEESKAAA